MLTPSTWSALIANADVSLNITSSQGLLNMLLTEKGDMIAGGADTSEEKFIRKLCLNTFVLSKFLIALEGGKLSTPIAGQPERFGFLNKYFQANLKLSLAKIRFSVSKVQSVNDTFTFNTLSAETAALIILMRSSAIGLPNSLGGLITLKHFAMTGSSVSIDSKALIAKTYKTYQKYINLGGSLSETYNVTSSAGGSQKVNAAGALRVPIFTLFMDRVNVVSIHSMATKGLASYPSFFERLSTDDLNTDPLFKPFLFDEVAFHLSNSNNSSSLLYALDSSLNNLIDLFESGYQKWRTKNKNVPSKQIWEHLLKIHSIPVTSLDKGELRIDAFDVSKL